MLAILVFQSIGSAEWFDLWILWWRRIALIYASFVISGRPDELVVEDPGIGLLRAGAEVVGIGEAGAMVSDGSSGPLKEVVVVGDELGITVGVVEVRKPDKPRVLVGQGHVVKDTLTCSVTVNVAV